MKDCRKTADVTVKDSVGRSADEGKGEGKDGKRKEKKINRRNGAIL